MHSGHTRLVRQMQLMLNGSRPDGDLDGQLPVVIAELEDRVRRIQRSRDGFEGVRLSGYVAGLRAVSVPDRVGGATSPGMV